MNAVEEKALVFSCNGANLVGILHIPQTHENRAVVIVVGGPQTRVGSHRQFVLLARQLASSGVPTIRFDYRGMGDSEGTDRGFEHASYDIKAAIDVLCNELPKIDKIILWGLCDAASAAMMYAPGDKRVAGIVALNPWVRSEAGKARVYLEHYYGAQLLSRSFWKRLFTGKVNITSSIASLLENIRKSLTPKPDSDSDTNLRDSPESTFQERMLEGMESFPGHVLLILSGNDLTAAEFRDFADASRPWRRVLAGSAVMRREIPEANHTFSRREWRDQVADWSINWVKSL